MNHRFPIGEQFHCQWTITQKQVSVEQNQALRPLLFIEASFPANLQAHSIEDRKEKPAASVMPIEAPCQAAASLYAKMNIIKLTVSIVELQKLENLSP